MLLVESIGMCMVNILCDMNNHTFQSQASLASGVVDVCLIPEEPFELEVGEISTTD
jgi:hypothetical protein